MKTEETKIGIEKTTQFHGHTGAIYSLEEASSEQYFFSGASDNILVEWDLSNPKENKVIAKFSAMVMAIKYIPKRNFILIGQSMGGVHIIDLNINKEIKLLKLHQQSIYDIQYLHERECFWVASADGSVSVWSINDFSLIKQISLCNKKIRSDDFNIRSKEAAIGCGDGTIRIFDFETFEEKIVLNEHLTDFSVNAVCYHPNGKYLLSGSRDATLKIWEIDTNYSLSRNIMAHNFAIYSIVFSPDNKKFATGSRDKTIKIWDATNFELLIRIDNKKYGGHTHSVNKLLWGKYENQLISAGDDKMVMTWKINEHQ